MDGSVVSGCPEVQFRGFEDGVDVDLPQPARLRVPLERLLDWQCMLLIDGFGEGCFMSFSMGVINVHLKPRRMSKGIFGVTPAHFEVEVCCHCKE